MLEPPVAGAGKEGRRCRGCMNEKQGRGVVSNIKALSARRVDSIVGCGGGGFFFPFFSFGSCLDPEMRYLVQTVCWPRYDIR